MPASTEPDHAFLKRLLAEMDAQETAALGGNPQRVTIDAADLERLIKHMAGIPSTAMQIS